MASEFASLARVRASRLPVGTIHWQVRRRFVLAHSCAIAIPGVRAECVVNEEVLGYSICWQSGCSDNGVVHGGAGLQRARGPTVDPRALG